MTTQEHGIVNIGIFVDTQAVMSSKGQSSATNTVYMCDDNGGSFNLTTNMFSSMCHNGDTIVWWVYSLNGQDSVSFSSITSAGGVLHGISNANNSNMYRAIAQNTGNQSYTIIVNVEGVQYSWDPYISCN